jgi:rare lipoprotein A
MRIFISTLLLGGILSAAHAAEGADATAPATVAGESGLAAVYSDKLEGHKTASGQIYDGSKLTAAHKTLAFGTKVKVTNAKNGKSVIVRINDRGPKQANRVLDITPRAARALGISKLGMAEVTLESVN